jgi:hypothetical protein
VKGNASKNGKAAYGSRVKMFVGRRIFKIKIEKQNGGGGQDY